MSQFTSLTDKEAHAILAQYHLGKVTCWNVLDGGSANTNCKIETEKSSYVLTISDEKSLEETEALAALLEHLAQNDFHTSKIIRNRKNQAVALWNDKPVMLKEYLQGEIMEDFPAETLEGIGEQLGRLHQIDVPPFLLHQFSYGKEQFYKLKAHALNTPFQQWLLNMEKYITEHISDDLPRALVHGDIFSSNVIIDPGHSTPVIMDFEEACHYYRVFDVGMSIIGLCSENGEVDLKKVKHLLRGYTRVIKMTPSERKSLKAFTVYAAAATAFWRYRQFNFINPDPALYNHYREMQNIANYVNDLPEASFYRP